MRFLSMKCIKFCNSLTFWRKQVWIFHSLFMGKPQFVAGFGSGSPPGPLGPFPFETGMDLRFSITHN